MSSRERDIAVVGMSGKFPGADGIAELWRNLCVGTESIATLSDEQLRVAGVSDADLRSSSYVRAAALLKDVELFDPGFFKIAPLEAELMDPQMRLLLQCAWEALEDAGHATKEPQNIGVFAGAGGVTTSYFANFVNVDRRFEKITAGPAHLGNDKDFLATYISYKLNLTGPSVTVQTACSTSLVALHQARMSLLNGECDMALAGGVSVRVPHALGYHYREGYIFSKSGHIRAFDEGADGVVFGSGLGLVLIKRLSDAIRDGNRIYAVIKGSAITNDGKGKMSYAASSAKGQIACINSALRDAGIRAEDIGLVESHGTGTSMGDPEEVKALSAAFKAQTDRKGYCALGAVKANVGHLEAAAGITGFIKAALAVERGVIPPVAHFSKPNPRIRFENTPFYVNAAAQQWSSNGSPRRAAVNSLGVGGTNAFVILEEYVPAVEASVERSTSPVIVPVSAKSQASLDAYVRKLADHLAAAATNTSIDIGDLAYTLQVGRESMDRRVAFVATSVEELQSQLRRYLDGLTTPGHDVFLPTEPSDVEREPPDIQASIEARDLNRLAQCWVDKFAVAWEQLYANARQPQRIHLPTYVFAKERCWIDVERSTPARTVLHPLLHINTSDLNEQKYTSTFDGNEFFLNDHLVRAADPGEREPRLQKILPGVAYLEMARAAIERAVPAEPDARRVVELRNVIWVQPLAVAEPRQVDIVLLSRPSTVDFEVYSDEQTIHCQGQASFVSDQDPAALDIAALGKELRQDQWSADQIYPAFDSMGLCYGPAHRSLVGIDRGERQLLAHLKLPESVAASQSEFTLHPSVMDGVLQATIGVLFDLEHAPVDPEVPFAVDLVRVLSPCTSEMVAWVRHAPTGNLKANLVKLDIDLCELDGKICVQLRGFASRSLSKSPRANEGTIRVLAAGEWQPAAVSDVAAAVTYAERHVIVCGLSAINLDALAGEAPSRQVLRVPLDDGKGVAERYTDVTIACFERVQAILRSKPHSKVLVQLVAPSDGEDSLVAGLTGLLKTARLENPQLIGQVVLVSAGIDTQKLATLLSSDQCRPGDALIKHDLGARHVFGWRARQERGSLANGGAFKSGGVYLLTGGLGGLGALFAKEILSHVPDARIVVTGRLSSGDVDRADGHRATLESLRSLGAEVEYRQLNLDDSQQVAQTIASICKRHKRIDGILHCAGMVADSFILKKHATNLRQVLAPKVQGTDHLDQATQHLDLDFFALFSSLTSAVGNAGQADYAAANGFMDQFAGYRNRLVISGQRRGRTVAIHWPFWQDGGMQLDASGLELLYETTGVRPMATATGMQAFYESLASDRDEMLPMEGDPAKIQHTLRTGLAVAEDRVSIETERAVVKSDATTSASQPDLLELTQSYLCRQLSVLLKVPAHKVHARAPLEDYGIDSILALSFTRVLEKDFGSLPKTLFFEYLTIRELAGYFVGAHAAKLGELFSIQGSTPAPRVEPQIRAQTPGAISKRASRRRFAEDGGEARSAQAAVAQEPIAIIGLSGRYPQSRDIDAFWDNLRTGKDCIVEVPPQRWDWREYYSDDRTRTDRHFSKWGGFIEGVDEFDPRFFNISPREAATIDPQERLFLQHCWMAVEDAGYTRERLQIPREGRLAGQVGVYAGVMYGEYNLSGSLASIANRVSYVLNLHGPSITLDTMCSSSLTAIHLACQDLKHGRTDLAIAGGVNVSIHPNKYLMLSSGQFISSDGHCQSFGEGGDGYIPAEGVGVVILKRLSEARRDGDHIYGIIRGSSVNHGGKTNGYTVPNPQAQAAVIGDVLLEAQVDARQISYLEAHGTGTKLGDPIEIAALSKAFQRFTQDTGFCLIGSAKSNIGHAESAAGVAGLTKVLLQMKHRQIVLSLHSERLNPHIDFASTPFVVNQSLREWSQPVIDGQPRPRMAGISSFGAGGANAHLIVEEFAEEAVDRSTQSGEVLIPLSARTTEQLQQKIQDLLAFVKMRPSLQLSELAFTLQTGREALTERLGLVVGSVGDLEARLQSCLQSDGQLGEGIFRGRADSHRDTLSMITADADFEATVQRWIERKKLDKLLSVWVQGFNVDWRKLWADAQPRRISLPTYPFARERYWLAGPAFPQTVALAQVSPAARPMQSTEVALPLSGPASDRVDASTASVAKPTNVILIDSAAAPLEVRNVTRPLIRLDAIEPQVEPSDSSSVSVLDRGDGVFFLNIDAAATDNALSTDLIEQLIQALADVAQESSLKVLVITGNEADFLSGGRESCDEAIERGLYQAIASFPAPVIAALQGHASGAGFLLGALCDFMIVSREGRYAFTLPHVGLLPSADEFLLLSERFGEVRATEFLYVSPEATGASLIDAKWGCPALPHDQVPSYVQKLATRLAGMPRESLQLLKTHLAREISRRVAALRPAGDQASRKPALAAPRLPLPVSGRFIRIDLRPEGVLLVTARAVNDGAQARSLVSELTGLFAQLGAEVGYRSVVVASEAGTFLDGLDQAASDDAVLKLQQTLHAVRIPVIGALSSGASGLGWLISQYFDLCVYGETGVNSLVSLFGKPQLAQAAAAIFPVRFGATLGNEIVLTGAVYDGLELKSSAGAVLVAPNDQVISRALEIASAWSRFPAAVLQDWKESRLANIETIAATEIVEAPDQVVETVVPQPVALASEVIHAVSHPGGILVVTMADRDARNRFSDALIAGMNEVFRHIEDTPAYKVVVLTGFDNYFASGGTKEALLAIQQGTLKYTDVAVFELPLRCELPVIAAMQGHTVGAGWSLGLFCDLMVGSEESIHSTRFMSFGFTPGAASTLVFPHKLGRDLSLELLMTAQEVSGRALRERRAAIPMYPRREVLPAAMQLAEMLARQERSELIALKRQLNRFVGSRLDDTYRYELEMQERTFVGQRHVLERIRSSYMQDESDQSMTVATVDDNTAGQAVADKLAGLTAGIGKLLADELYLREDEIDEHTQFIDLGLDSITGVTWIRKINEKYGLSVEATKVYSHPTLAELSRYIRDELLKQTAAPQPTPARVSVAAAPPDTSKTHATSNRPAAIAAKTMAVPARQSTKTRIVRATESPAPVEIKTTVTVTSAPAQAAAQLSTTLGPIAVVGMAGQFPKAATLQDFWNNIAGGVDCVGVVPRQRWDVDALYQEGAAAAGKTVSKWMGSLENYDRFDPLFFSISPTEAEAMDPQQRLFLQACWHAIEDAGYAARSLSGSKTGVFAGCAAGDYYRDPSTQRLNAQQLMGNAPSILAARISYFLNLQGPCVSVDTACSSSLVALATACDSLSSGASDVALAGGVQVMAGPAMHIMTSQAGMLSPGGRCFTFDERANGFVPAEAVGVVMLKRLADAERDQDFIYGVIRGWGVNQDGKTNGITAPNPESQTRLQQSVYDKYQIDPEQIQLIEAHGTGTKLGDPIEIDGLKAAFGKYTSKMGYCAVGSVKSNMGHALNAAGIAGFIKLMLALKHRQLPPTIHCERINQHIALENSPFYINGELREWPSNGTRLRQAAISSFGFSGTNCHMVVSEAASATAVRSPVVALLQNGQVPIPLSARTDDQLKQRVVDLLQFIRSSAAGIGLQELAYVQQVGRDPMDHRLGVMAATLDELADKLRRYLDQGDAADGCYRGQAKQNKESLRVITQDEVVRDTIIEKYLARGELYKLLQLWTKGFDVDWNRLYGAQKPRRIGMPVYPFAQERYWLESSNVTSPAGASNAGSQLHPLLHRNVSDFSEQRYVTELTGTEPFLADHLVAGKKVLPGVAYLEMARAAITDATGGVPAGALTLRNVVWSRPVVVADEPKSLRIALHPKSPNEFSYQITSGIDGSTQQVPHGGGEVTFGVASAAPIDIQALRARTSGQQISHERYYRMLETIGLQYGPSHRRIVEMHVGAGEALARLAPLDSQSPYILHPGLLDAAFHASLAVQDTEQPVPLLPFALEQIEISSDCNRCTWAWARSATGATASDKLSKLDIDLFDDEGVVSVRVRGLSARAMESELFSEPTHTSATLLLEPVWTEQAAVSRSRAHESIERFLFLCGFDSIALALQRQLSDTTVISLSMTAPTPAERFHAHALQIFECLQRSIERKSEGSVLIQVLIPDSDDGELYAGLWSLLQSAHLESSKIVGQLIALDPATPGAEVCARLQENSQCEQTGPIRYRQERRFVRQLAELTLPASVASPWRDGTYLITGGAGGLGLIFAKAIAGSTRSTVILTGRSELDEAGRQRIQRLQTNGSRVEYRRVDVTDGEAVRALLRNIQSERGGLTGILHCAGIIRDNYIARKPSADFSAVLGPKIAGTQHLDEASRSLALDFFVLFSSIGGVLGGAGQADYAVANAFMDGYATYRNRLVASGQRSGRTLSINWPLWQSEGMGVDAAKEAFFKAHFGMLAMPEARGLQVFHRALSSDRSQVMVMDGILQRMRQRLIPGQAAPSRAMATQPMHEPASHEVTAAPGVVPEGDMLASRVRETLRRKVARFLKMQDEALDYDTELTEFGFDSISLTELTNQLNQELKLDLTPTVFFEYPTLSGLAAHLSEARRDVFVSKLAPRVVEVPRLSAPPAELKRRSRLPAMPVTREIERADDPIAIIGMSGKFPQAETLDQFWENLRAGRDCIEEVPASRWDWQAVYGDPRTEDNKTNIKWGGFIDGVDEFDPLFFGISPREAQLMDPQQRLLMTYAWKVIEDAGYAPQSLSGSSVGIFVGTYTSGYQELAAQAGIAVDGYFATGMSTSIGPNRMSYFLNLHGPSEPIETACSSSLVAIHRAVQAIKTGSCEAAIVGGVNAIVNPSNHIAFSKAGMLSPDGRCKTFSNRANGYVRGEGVGMLFLKKLSAAERDGDRILAVIRGTAENHGGRASSLTAPNPKAQASLLQTAYRQAGVDPRTVGYIEAHGTGTELGDPIEINALKSAFQTLYAETSQGESVQPIEAHCALGSLKSNIGHLELAAGVAGVIKVLLQLKHKTRIGTLHCDTVNPYIDLTGTAFYIARQNDEWPRLKDRAGQEVPRRAGVSSFGFGGVNAHVVIEEYVSARSAPALASEAGGPHLIVLSARTETSLAQAVTNLASYLEEEGRTTDLASIAYTLQVGRDGMEQRLAMVVRSREELLDKLRKFASGDDAGDLYRGEIKRGQDALSVFAGDEDLRDAVDVWIQKGKYDKLLSLWVKGLAFDWNKLYGESRPRRVSLPTYAFARERVWIERVAGLRQSLPESAASQPVRDSLHPLVHIDTSRPDQQSYRTTLIGTEFFLADHQVRSDAGAAKPVLPAVAYLEMARAAVEHALRDQRAAGVLELRGTAWLKPCIVTAPREVSISLYARDEDVSVDFEILSHAAGEASVHCQGWATFVAAERIERFDLEQLRQRINGTSLQPSDVYSALDNMGLNYGPAHRAVAAVQVGDGELLARLKLPSTVGLAPYLLHPSLMDGALQASIAFLLARTNVPAQPWVPFALESARIVSACQSEMYAWIRRSDAADSLLKVDIDLFDAQGNACVALRGVSARALQPVNVSPAFDDSLYHRIIDSVMNNELSIDAAVDLG